jgi:phosphohistidine phosphatase
MAAWTPPPEIRFEQSLYLAEPETILRLLAALPDAADGVMVIGHNPGLQALAVRLGGSGGEALRRLRSKFPTGGLAVLDLEIDRWRDIADASGTLFRFVAPRDLD